MTSEQAGFPRCSIGTMIKMEDKQIQCVNCQRVFAFTAGDQEFYQERGMSAPKRCKTCREARKPNNGEGSAKDGGRVERAARAMDALFKPASKSGKK